MCILFIHGGGASAGGYRLILASNRDEYFNRPADKAAPWKEDNEVIGGRDMEPGREGGTWLACCPQRRRIAALLNLPGVPSWEHARGRGSIVSNFVLGNDSTEEYLEEYHKNGHEYSAFNLVTVHVGNSSSVVHHYSNVGDETITYENAGVLAFGNSPPIVPFKKVEAGKQKFEDIINRCTIEGRSKEMLIGELLTLLQWKQQHLPDEELERRRPEAPDSLAAVFVDIPKISYGTRTHTIILVDAEGNFDFYEWTLIPEETVWEKTHIHKKL